MAILERDPWRLQYFEGIACPEHVVVPTDDIDAWPLNPAHNWVYDRLQIALSQGLQAAPHGVPPPSFPVFSKPIINLRGMGLGSRVISSAKDMQRSLTAGHFWMPLLAGPHLSTDIAMEDGSVRWLRSAQGESASKGMFRYWTLLEQTDQKLRNYLVDWMQTNLQGYTGMVNCETIGGRIIETHLRFADQWCDLNGEGWIDAVISLYGYGRWNWPNSSAQQGFSIPLFAKPDRLYRHPPPELQNLVRSMPHVSSLQITFHDGVEPRLHPMPPGGMRLALINCWDLQAGLVARDELAKAFPEDAIIAT